MSQNKKVNLFYIDRENVFYIICLVSFLIFVGAGLLQILQFYRIKRIVTSMTSNEVISFKIYPGAIAPVGPSIIFKPPSPVIDTFFQSIKDMRSSWTNYSPANEEYVWFLEIATQKGDIIQLSCTIPAKKRTYVVGMLNDHDFFKSRQLYQWYQDYSHRWLNSDEP